MLGTGGQVPLRPRPDTPKGAPMASRSTHIRSLITAALTSSALGIAAPAAASTPPADSTPTTLSAGAATNDALCDPFFAAIEAMDADQPDPAVAGPALDAAVAAAPDELHADMVTAASLGHQQLDGTIKQNETPPIALFNSLSNVSTYLFDHCRFDGRLDVQGTEYSFTGIPAQIPSGTYGILLRNTGGQQHMMGIFRRNDGETAAWQDLLMLPQDQFGSHVQPVTFSFAPANGNAWLRRIALTPGDYVAVCFITEGSVVKADGSYVDGTGPAHFMKGMMTEFHVS